MTPEVDRSSELTEARRRVDELESLVEISPVAIVVMDTHERVTGWNPAAAQLFGYSSQGGDRASDSSSHEKWYPSRFSGAENGSTNGFRAQRAHPGPPIPIA